MLQDPQTAAQMLRNQPHLPESAQMDPTGKPRDSATRQSGGKAGPDLYSTGS